MRNFRLDYQFEYAWINDPVEQLFSHYYKPVLPWNEIFIFPISQKIVSSKYIDKMMVGYFPFWTARMDCLERTLEDTISIWSQYKRITDNLRSDNPGPFIFELEEIRNILQRGGKVEYEPQIQMGSRPDTLVKIKGNEFFADYKMLELHHLDAFAS